MIIKQAEAIIPTELGEWTIIAYAETEDVYSPHLALQLQVNHDDLEAPTLVRVHSECITGDLFASTRCDCGEQLHHSLDLISQQGGVLIYLRQEGRGIGIINKLKAYNLQDQGADTIDANKMLGHGADERSYTAAITILNDLNILRINLLTNNPHKISAFQNSPITISKRTPLVVSPRKENKEYLRTKEKLMGHLFDL